MMSDALTDDSIRASWAQLDTRFPLVEAIFPACMADAQGALTPDGLSAFLEAGRIIGKLGRGAEPLLAFLEAWPSTARAVGEDLLAPVMAVVQGLQKSPNGRAITPFLQTLAPVAQRLQAGEQLQHYLDLTLDLMARTTRSIHGFHTTYPSPGLPDFFNQAPTLLAQLDIGGLRRWVDYGVRNYATHPERQKDYFSLQSADARAVLQRERHGTLLVDVERHLDLYLRALWRDGDLLIPYSTAFDELRKPVPYYDPLGIRLPDVQDDASGVSGLDRYRAMLAHMVGHRRWSTPQIADNWSPFQRMAVEFFEDCRVETLLIREYAGLRRLFLALHPRPVEDACDPATTSCLRHRLAMLSRALLDPEHGYRDADLNTFVARFHALMAQGTSSTRDIAALALAYVAKTRRQSDQFAKVHFENTVIDYRDDNRHLWRFIEQGDEEERFDETRRNDAQDDLPRLPPRHYPEWDYHSQTYRPDWVSVYEGLHPSAQAGDIDRLLQKHAPLAKRLQRMLELLKPQDKVRIRYQEDGSELDLDVAIRSLIDFKAGSNPDPRINLSHRTNGRDIAVTLLLDLSASLNDKVKGSDQTILELSQEAVSLLAWAIDRLGDPLAIAGFQSNTRHEVRYQHFKGFGEPWGDEVKARLAAMQANYSTRMGAALRHAAHSLRARKSDKKLLLILTDGEPADIDVQDERLLIEDARQAVRELERNGLFTYCISLDPRADAYVSDIFGRRYTVIDNIERLPERLPEVFLALTK
ncbi:putative Rubisco activation protein CbbO [Thiomonas arsenitoxydans]|uniref:Rubisco activation protein CbbO n=2 Tax=Thiomonas arsenitoxydans (strain DSM 22701 / CIP 110005 / 3As) TaxID=426114 RepID=A0ABM9T0M3_THIA3|nr:putative Rubisco activation protein CbbO [Thiomonas arsenitoxydans]CQR27895.1 putative Rubisco activation protein CbbO [Thiomonas arsenitoxydans]CQR34955.1 putative Rubisco activation protein CbbO [Thiomonas arsenitoxydans]CQR35013.1 putative Rubisco activation protein CbbO [Thiomonas arsenitoxydans]CQR44177.1 putative Rubisco activation protein CbbO [Thiomonas sp. CB3]